MQYNKSIVKVKQLLQCDANTRNGEQSMNCIFYPLYSYRSICILNLSNRALNALT